MKMVFSSHQRGRRDVTCNGDGNGNKEFKKAIGLLSKSSTLHVQHTFFVRYLCRLLHEDNMKFPNRTFYGRRTQRGRISLFSLVN